ncbi:LysR family transcriptional regulator [Thalassotalea psychrophila]|uniref:LysR family transcriptional regulator n=1 Tax=Thalassotalea psychrophila TaxID=3065647 RepID=A0ABY9TYJ9_9GAMM|nr:LysR family transcriptional regulator [Colwelliaceae bacterium SQ149]
MKILEQKLSRIDLNLLVSLSVLLKERHVGRSAEILFITQPAMSRTLQRLRDLFDDQLFYRTSVGISPTAKALELERILPETLESLNNILSSEEFDPLTCEQGFSISIPSMLSHNIILPLFNLLHTEAPNIELTESTAKSNPFDLLEAGTLDFAIHVAKDIPARFNAMSLGIAKPAIFARKGHPLTSQKEVSLIDCMKYDFVALNVENNQSAKFTGPVEIMLAKKGVSKEPLYKTSQLQMLLEIMQNSDCLFIGPSLLIQNPDLIDRFKTVYEFNLPKKDLIEFFLLEHKRSENSKAHQWFKGKLLNQIEKLT